MTKLGETIAAGLVGSALLFGATAAAQDGGALFAEMCAGCHNDKQHPKGLVYNAAGNVAIIEAVNAKGMGAPGSLADHTTIATYLDSVKPKINTTPVPHDSPGTTIELRDIIVSGAEQHADWKIVFDIVTVSPPTKGTVSYTVENGFGVPSYVNYTPFPGQSGIDTWTYQGTGPGANTTIRTASVYIASDATTAFDLNRYGLTGSWFQPLTAGQGSEIEVYPDLIAPGTGFMQGAMFTYDYKAPDGPSSQRWYTFSGDVKSGQPSATLTIYQNVGGNFNAPPVTTAMPAGTIDFSATDCTHATMKYTFTDGSMRSGTIPMGRLLPNVTCSSTGQEAPSADFAYSGNWFDKTTSGQGIVVEVNPKMPVTQGQAVTAVTTGGFVFFAWYTYAPNGQSLGEAGQRWYTGQAPYTPGARTLPMTLYESTGGLFDSATPAVPPPVAVGTATATFTSCSALNFAFNFTGGSSGGTQGTINMTRVGPTPSGCGP
jgi:hypothetical protein